VLEIMPMAVLPPATPLTCQVTAVLLDPVTAAAKACIIPVCTLALAGVTATATGDVIVTCADEDLVASAADTAVTMTAAGDGTTAGAV